MDLNSQRCDVARPVLPKQKEGKRKQRPQQLRKTKRDTKTLGVETGVGSKLPIREVFPRVFPSRRRRRRCCPSLFRPLPERLAITPPKRGQRRIRGSNGGGICVAVFSRAAWGGEAGGSGKASSRAGAKKDGTNGSKGGRQAGKGGNSGEKPEREQGEGSSDRERSQNKPSFGTASARARAHTHIREIEKKKSADFEKRKGARGRSRENSKPRIKRKKLCQPESPRARSGASARAPGKHAPSLSSSLLAPSAFSQAKNREAPPEQSRRRLDHQGQKKKGEKKM